MKYVKGYTKDDYRDAPTVLEFETIEQAAEYLANKHKQSVEYMIRSIKDDTNCDAIYFDDGSVILREL